MVLGRLVVHSYLRLLKIVNLKDLGLAVAGDSYHLEISSVSKLGYSVFLF